jgi:beta-lactamase superfamily II metal-dependent hydrolase
MQVFRKTTRQLTNVAEQRLRKILEARSEAAAPSEPAELLFEPPVQDEIAKSMPKQDFDVIKVAHHGSRYQSSDFATWVNAEFAVISVGAGNDYGHPAQETISLYELTGSKVFRTDLSGDIAIIVRDSKIWVASSH